MPTSLDRWLATHWQPQPTTRWRRSLVGSGTAIVRDDGLRLIVPSAGSDHYADAQIDDYRGLPRRRFPWRPPLRLTARARFSGMPSGTAGFGFWNHPFSPLGEFPALPQSIWFFHASPPANIALADGVPGYGWKAATLDAARPRALRWAPLAPIVVLLNRWPAFRRRVWPLVQRDLAIAEALLPTSLTDWHSYTIEWRVDGARFLVDQMVVWETDRAPHGPLGFVAWVDNQWAVATPTGRLGGGLVAVDQPEWLDLADVVIEPLHP